MKIQRASFVGVRGVPDLTLDLTDARTGRAHALVVVTGPNGSGKTRMLEALIAAKEAIAPYGLTSNGGAWLAPGKNVAKMTVAFELDEAERLRAATSSSVLEAEVTFTRDQPKAEAPEGLRAVLRRYSHEAAPGAPADGKLEYIPSDRRVALFPPFTGLGAAEQRLHRASKDPRKFGFVLPFLRALDHDVPRRERFTTSLTALSATCRWVADPEHEAVPRCFSSRGGPAMTAAQISHGEADAVIFAATAATIGLDRSIVFIDRPERHADDLGRLVTGLASLGQDNQLFLAGRPELAASASAASGAHVVTLKAA